MTRIAVDPGRVTGHLDRNVFGGFIEHLGRCIYGGIYDEGSPAADANGFRKDVLALLRDLRLGVLRWPGGNFVSNYHWADGIGPKDTRPRRPELAWGAEESNRFGTSEFLGYCAELGTEPYICLNMGTGSLEEALAWIEYCNGTGQTYWAQRRRENGHPAPYGVRYWGLGNEMYGDWQVGALSAEEYVRTATRWARAIKRLDPGAVLVSCGMNGWNDWDRVVIDGLAPLVDLHYYPVLLHAQAALDSAVDVWTDGPTVSPLGNGHHSRWSHRVADLGPFSLVDVAATVSADRRRLALTLVNRSPDEPDTAQIVLRDHAFDGPAGIRTVTANSDPGARPLPGIEGVHLSEGSETPDAHTVTLTLPPQSFTVVEAATTSR